MEKNRLTFLLERFNEGRASAAELAELEQLLTDPDVIAQLDGLWEKIPANANFFDEGRTEAMLAGIEERNRQLHQQQSRKKRRVFAMAASVTILLTATILYLTISTDKPVKTIANKTQGTSTLITPGDDKAMLVLADGSTILLEGADNRSIPVQGNTQITRIDGKIVYASNDTGANAPVVYNTLKTPRGGQYQLQLADGSKVWMNAGSSLYFPTSFRGKERMVQLTGEAYFEIAKDAQRPFRVTVNDMQVNVLGTHFNIMAYDNEAATAVTLLEGAVSVERNHESVKLRPGQQAQSADHTSIKVLNDINPEEAVAWKNGYFITNNTSLPVLMRQVERWYNVEVVYEGKVPNKQFGGKIPRKSDLKEVLEVLELSKVYTKVEGNKVTILDR